MALKSDGTVIIDTRVDTKGFNSGVNSMQKRVGGLSNSFKKLGVVIASAFAIKAIVDFGRKAIELGSDLEEVQNVVHVVFSSMEEDVNKFAKEASESFGLSETMAKRYVGTFGAMSKSFGFAEAEAFKMSTTLTGLAGDIASFYNITQDEAYTKLKSVFTGETETLKDLGVVMTQNALDAFAMAEGIGKTTREMTEQEKVALRYSFVLKQLQTASGDFARTSDSWANQMRMLKLNVQSIMATFGQALINFFTPVIKLINVLLSKIATLANAFKAFSEMIMGKKASGGGSSGGSGGIIDDTTESLGGLSDGYDDVAESTKKADKANKKYLSGLDEIRTYTSDIAESASSSGKGAGSLGGSSVDFGEIADIDEEVKEALNLTPYEIGQMVRDAIINALDSIDWNAIYDKARTLARNLAQFLNGLFSYDGEGRTLFGQLAKAFANTLNTIIYFAQEFAREFDFYQFGVNIADAINEFFRNFDFQALAQTLNDWITGFNNYWQGFFDKLDVSAIADAINTFFDTFDFKNLATTLNNFVDNLEEAIGEFLREIDWKDIVKGIGEFLGGLDVDTIIYFIGLRNIAKFAKSLSGALGKETGKALAGGALAEGSGGIFSGAFIVFKELAIAIGAVATAIHLLKDPLIDLSAKITGNEEGAKRLKEEYDGLGGTARLVGDSFKAIGTDISTAFSGLPAEFNLINGAMVDFEKAFKEIDKGVIYTDEQLGKLQTTFGASTDDIEMLRQAMLDANPALRDIADTFGLFDASAETLEDVSIGLKAIADGTVSIEEAGSEFSKTIWYMTDDAKAFFEQLSSGEQSMDTFKSNMENIGYYVSEGLTVGMNDVDMEKPATNIFTALRDAIKEKFGINSPAKAMNPYGEFIILGIVEGFNKAFGVFKSVLSDFLTKYIDPIFSKDKWTFSGIKDGFYASFELAINNVKALLSTVSNWMFTNFVTPILTLCNYLIEQINLYITLFIQSFFETINLFFDAIIEVVKTAFEFLKGLIDTAFTWIIENVGNCMENIQKIWSDAWNNVLNTVIDIWDRIVSKVRNAISTIMGLVEKVKSAFNEIKETASNLMSSASNSISNFTNRVFGGSTRTPNVSRIPKLASGSVIPPNAPFLAVLGDQKRGTNIEAPLDTIKQAVREVVGSQGASGNVYVKANVDGREIFELVLDKARLMQASTGSNVLVTL